MSAHDTCDECGEYRHDHAPARQGHAFVERHRVRARHAIPREALEAIDAQVRAGMPAEATPASIADCRGSSSCDGDCKQPDEAAPDEAALIAERWSNTAYEMNDAGGSRRFIHCAREAYAAGRKVAFGEINHDNAELVTEVAYAIGETLKHQPEMGGNCRTVHGEETNQRSARAAIRAIARRAKETK